MQESFADFATGSSWQCYCIPIPLPKETQKVGLDPSQPLEHLHVSGAFARGRFLQGMPPSRNQEREKGKEKKKKALPPARILARERSEAENPRSLFPPPGARAPSASDSSLFGFSPGGAERRSGRREDPPCGVRAGARGRPSGSGKSRALRASERPGRGTRGWLAAGGESRRRGAERR